MCCGVWPTITLLCALGDLRCCAVSLMIDWQILGVGAPRADIIPVKQGLDVQHAGGVLHHDIVEGLLRQRG